MCFPYYTPRQVKELILKKSHFNLDILVKPQVRNQEQKLFIYNHILE